MSSNLNSENYYIQVKDFLTEEMRKKLIIRYNEIDLSSFYKPQVINDETGYMNQYRDLHSEVNSFKFHNIANNPSFYEIFCKDTLNDIQEIYDGEFMIFIHSTNDTDVFPIHKDPKISRQCCLNIPLIPDYSEYRPTHFYEDITSKEPLLSINYPAIRSPVLMNLQKFHNVGGHDKPSTSLALQVSWRDKTYMEVKAMLANKGFLIYA